MVSKAGIIDRCDQLPSLLIGIGKNSFWTHLCAFFTEATLIDFKVYLRKTTVSFDDNICFTALDAFVTPTADIGKLYICTTPWWADSIRLTATKKTAAALIDIAH